VLNERPWSERTAEAIDMEVRAIIEQNYDRARTTLRKHRSLLDDLATDLKEREEIGGNDLRERVMRSTQHSSIAMDAMQLRGG
jgi:cell division protease FtsH